MKRSKIKALSTAGMLIPMLLSSCNKSEPINKEEVIFTKEDLVQQSFGGLGVEWGAYEDTDKLMEGGWDRVISHISKLKLSRIRLMISYDWICSDLDKKGTEDKSDDTWSYSFTNKWFNNVVDILSYCQANNVDVAFGAWNVIANLQNDTWGMMDEVTSDIRWSKITADVLDYLVHKKGFTCIKWFVNSNEPNYSGMPGASKNWNNTYEIWEQGVKNVRKALDDIGLNNIGIVGGDTTGFEGSKEYLTNIARNIPDKVGDYGVHLYISNMIIDRGQLMTAIKDLYDQIKKIDKGLGVTRQAEVWEAGLLDGKDNATDCNGMIQTTSYGVRMADYTIQCALVGLNSVVYWDLDDAMHFMYNNNTVSAKEWGMFSTLADAEASKQELRPWYHSSKLLINLLQKGNRIYGDATNNPEFDNSFRSLATIASDGSRGGIVAVNQGMKAVEKTFYIDEKVSGDHLYIYEFNASKIRLNSEGYIEPNYIIEGSLNNKLKVTIPAGGLFVVSTEKL